MEIIWKQSVAGVFRSAIVLEAMGIEQCYLKQIYANRDRKYITDQQHHHNGFELHLVEQGYQIYELEGRRVKVEAGYFLLIPPLIKHCAVEESPDMAKSSFTFATKKNSPLSLAASEIEHCILKKTPDAVWENIRTVCTEKKRADIFCTTLICNRVLECILLLFRACGVTESSDISFGNDADIRVTLAKQYIADNPCQSIAVSEVAAYCHLGTKQLTRIFQNEEGVAVAEYIRRERCRYIETLLADSELSLCEISDKAGFSNEYNFNAFFKKYAGMSPGVYRKSIKKEG
ncbi:MAG: helix-turn-helix transcriptional regulator [Clostridia bacterium]|nr:helix-turn-helix transcriptional regulator [Clostridia bacterium]